MKPLVRARGPGRQGVSAVPEELSKLPPCGVLAETAGGSNPYFASGAGGSRKALIVGFGGLEIGSGGSAQRAGGLPSQWKRLEIRGAGPRRQNYEVR